MDQDRTSTRSASDAELLAAWRRKEATAGQHLVRRYFPVVYRFFHNKVRTEADIDDLVQRTFVALVERAERLELTSFRAYLLGVAHYVLCGHYRAVRRQDERFDLGSISAEDVGTGVFSAFAEKREHQRLLVALRKIPLEHQTLLELFYWEEMTGDEIAAVLGIPVGTFRSRLRKARELLEAALQAEIKPEELEGTLECLQRWAEDLRGRRGS